MMMKIGLLGLFTTDLTDVTRERIKWAGELGFHGVGAHLNIPASTIRVETARQARALFDEQNMPFLQLWGPYPCIISPDESIRKAGVEGAIALAKLAAALGVKESGVRPTSLNPRGDWWPHADNFTPETEDRLVKSITEICAAAADLGIDIVLETHTTTTLNTAPTIKRVIERTGAKNLKINLDPCNFMANLQIAFDQTPTIDEIFGLLGDYIATVHLKDFYLEDRFVVHISETVIGTGLMNFDPILAHVNAIKPDGYVVIEHLPIGLIPLAKQNLTQKIKALGFKLG
jgi:sugar phosphate isomerase/epimerase